MKNNKKLTISFSLLLHLRSNVIDELYSNVKTLFIDINGGSLSSDELKMKSKELVKIIKGYVRIIRSSVEYRKFIRFLKFTKDISLDLIDESNDIEYHHAPFSLFDITTVVLSKQIHEMLSISSFTIAKTVMELHYAMLVGLVPLPSSVHKNVEDNNIPIPPDIIFGNWDKFASDYYTYFTRDTLEKYNNYRRCFFSDEEGVNPLLGLNNFLDRYSAKPTEELLLMTDIKNIIDKRMIGDGSRSE